MDHPGPMARCVRDLAILLQAIAGPTRDPGCATGRARLWPRCCSQSLPPPRLGRLRGLFEDLAEPAVLAMLEQVTGKLRAARGDCQFRSRPAGRLRGSPATAPHRHGRRGGELSPAIDCSATRRITIPNIRTCWKRAWPAPRRSTPAARSTSASSAREMLACFEGVDVLLTPATTSPAPDAAHHRRPGVQLAVELHRLADRLVPRRPEPRGPAAGDPARRPALGGGGAAGRGRLVRGYAGDRARAATRGSLTNGSSAPFSWSPSHLIRGVNL